jgi:hypothetical protein
MRQLIRWTARLYPAQWRERYGEELDALVEDIQPQWQDLFNVLLGALHHDKLKAQAVGSRSCIQLGPTERRGTEESATIRRRHSRSSGPAQPAATASRTQSPDDRHGGPARRRGAGVARAPGQYATLAEDVK